MVCNKIVFKVTRDYKKFAFLTFLRREGYNFPFLISSDSSAYGAFSADGYRRKMDVFTVSSRTIAVAV